MRNGSIDEFTSRRTNFDECEYWVRKDTDDLNELIYETRKRTGTFSAKQENNETSTPQVVGGVFMFSSRNVTISTNDDISDINENDIVKFRGEIYIVSQVQRILIKKNNQFYNEKRYKTYLSLRG